MSKAINTVLLSILEYFFPQKKTSETLLTVMSAGSRLGNECLEAVAIEKENRGGGANSKLAGLSIEYEPESNVDEVMEASSEKKNKI